MSRPSRAQQADGGEMGKGTLVPTGRADHMHYWQTGSVTHRALAHLGVPIGLLPPSPLVTEPPHGLHGDLARRLRASERPWRPVGPGLALCRAESGSPPVQIATLADRRADQSTSSFVPVPLFRALRSGGRIRAAPSPWRALWAVQCPPPFDRSLDLLRSGPGSAASRGSVRRPLARAP